MSVSTVEKMFYAYRNVRWLMPAQGLSSWGLFCIQSSSLERYFSGRNCRQVWVAAMTRHFFNTCCTMLQCQDVAV